MTHDELRYVRTHTLNYTQAQLADVLDVSEQTIRNWEAPPSKPNHRTISTANALAIQHLADQALAHSLSRSKSHPHSSSP